MLLAGCTGRNKPGGNSTTTDTVPEVMDTVATRSTEAECGSLQPGQFCSAGLDILRLGDSLTWNDRIRASLPEAVLKDTVFSEPSAGPDGVDTVSWFVKMMRLPDGVVYLEADFDSGHLLGRIRIESGRYHHVSGLRVGSAGKELKAYFTDAYVYPLPGHDVMEVVAPFQTGKMIFHFPRAGFYDSAKHHYTLADVPDEAKVMRIVLM